MEKFEFSSTDNLLNDQSLVATATGDWDDAWLAAIGFRNPALKPVVALGTFQIGVLVFSTIYDSGDVELYGSLDDIGKKFLFNNDTNQLVYEASELAPDKRRRLARELARRLVFHALTTSSIPFSDLSFGRHSLVDICPMFEQFYISSDGDLVWTVDPEIWFPRTLVGAGSWKIVARPSIGQSISDTRQEFMLDAIEYPWAWTREQVEAWVNRKWNLRDWVMEYRRVWGEIWRSRNIPEIENAQQLIDSWRPRVRQKTDFFFSNRSGQTNKKQRESGIAPQAFPPKQDVPDDTVE